MRDIERRLRQSERMFAALFETSPEAITLYRLSDVVRLAANAQWEQASGYRRDEVVGRPALNVSLFHDPQARAEAVAGPMIDGNILGRLRDIAEPGRERVRTHAFLAEGAIAPNFEYALESSPCKLAIEICRRRDCAGDPGGHVTRPDRLRRILGLDD